MRLIATVLLAACSHATAPIECNHRGLDELGDKLTQSQITHLCSGATNPNTPIDCYLAAKADDKLSLTEVGALELCSPFNLDASNARKAAQEAADKVCPDVSTSNLEQRLKNVEDQLAELVHKR
jgi:hypothetical protein